MSASWRYLANDSVVDFILDSRKAVSRRAIVALKQLMDNPAMRADAYLHDASGRRISIIRLGGFRIQYWVDHFAREVRIVDVAVA